MSDTIKHQFRNKLVTIAEAKYYLDWLKKRLEIGLLDDWIAEITHYEGGPSLLKLNITLDNPELPG